MSFWTDVLRGPWKTADNPGDPEGVVVEGDPVETRSLPFVVPSPWDGWPAEWSTPKWDMGSRYNELIDVAWACIDLNARVLSTMPVYRTRNGQVVSPSTWMMNPDPNVYSSWEEFAKQLFWDYQLGNVFVLPTAYFSDGWPMHFRVVPPWVIDAEVSGGRRRYRLGIGGPDITDEILHIRYQSSTDSAYGQGPLEVAGGKMLTAGILAKYVREFVSTGGVQFQTLETDQDLEFEDAQDIADMWLESRVKNLALPPILDRNVKLVDHNTASPAELAMIEISQFTEGRVADLLGVPRAFFGLPTGGSLTYTNPDNWFDHHDRTTLRPYATAVMKPLSYWSLPHGQGAELNRDEYSRPPFNERAEAAVKLIEVGAMSIEEYRASERLTGPAPERPEPSTLALTGGDQ